MGSIGILLILEAFDLGSTTAGWALGTAGVVTFALGFRYGFCPTCTLACLITPRKSSDLGSTSTEGAKNVR
jgi:hypothetical protein